MNRTEAAPPSEADSVSSRHNPNLLPVIHGRPHYAGTPMFDASFTMLITLADPDNGGYNWCPRLTAIIAM